MKDEPSALEQRADPDDLGAFGGEHASEPAGRSWSIKGVLLTLVAVGVVAGFLVYNHKLSNGRPVRLVNATGFAYDVEIDGLPLTIERGSDAVLFLSEGEHRVKIVDLPELPGADFPVPAAYREQTFEVPGNLWSRHMGGAALVLNPDEAASLVIVHHAYGSDVPPADERLPLALFHVVEGIDDPFQDPPQSVDVDVWEGGDVRRQLVLDEDFMEERIAQELDIAHGAGTGELHLARVRAMNPGTSAASLPIGEAGSGAAPPPPVPFRSPESPRIEPPASPLDFLLPREEQKEDQAEVVDPLFPVRPEPSAALAAAYKAYAAGDPTALATLSSDRAGEEPAARFRLAILERDAAAANAVIEELREAKGLGEFNETPDLTAELGVPMAPMIPAMLRLLDGEAPGRLNRIAGPIDDDLVRGYAMEMYFWLSGTKTPKPEALASLKADPAVAAPYLLLLGHLQERLREPAWAAAEELLDERADDIGFPIDLYREVLAELRG